MTIPYSPVPDGIAMFTLKDVLFSDSFGFKIQEFADEPVAIIGFTGARIIGPGVAGPEESVTIAVSMRALEQMMLVISNNYEAWREQH